MIKVMKAEKEVPQQEQLKEIQDTSDTDFGIFARAAVKTYELVYSVIRFPAREFLFKKEGGKGYEAWSKCEPPGQLSVVT